MNKAKYKLLNKWGNRVIFTDSDKEKNSLLDKGFRIDESWVSEEPKPTPPKKTTARKAVNKNEGQVD